MTFIIYRTVAVSQESGCSWVGLLQAPAWAVIQVSTGPTVSPKASLGKDPLPSSHRWWQDQSSRASVPFWMLARGFPWFPATWPSPMWHSQYGNLLCQNEPAKKASVCANEKEVAVFANEAQKQHPSLFPYPAHYRQVRRSSSLKGHENPEASLGRPAKAAPMKGLGEQRVPPSAVCVGLMHVPYESSRKE